MSPAADPRRALDCGGSRPRSSRRDSSPSAESRCARARGAARRHPRRSLRRRDPAVRRLRRPTHGCAGQRARMPCRLAARRARRSARGDGRRHAPRAPSRHIKKFQATDRSPSPEWFEPRGPGPWPSPGLWACGTTAVRRVNPGRITRSRVRSSRREIPTTGGNAHASVTAEQHVPIQSKEDRFRDAQPTVSFVRLPSPALSRRKIIR